MVDRSINEVIKDNQKKGENSRIINDFHNQTKNEEDNSPFKQLLSLQLLIQKHSGLKELCKQKFNSFLLI